MTNTNKETVFLEVTGLEDSKRLFDLDHAQNIMRIQQKKGRHDWIVCEGQKLTLQNGSIRPTTDSESAQTKSKK